MTKKLLQLYGLKWNPFAPDVPIERRPRHVPASRVSRGASSIWPATAALPPSSASPASGKSVPCGCSPRASRSLRDVVVGVLTRPQAGFADFYREIGHLFGVPAQPAQSLGRRQSAARHVARAHRGRAVSASAAHR